MEGILFTFGLICYWFDFIDLICPGSQKINILTSQYKQISDKQGVFTLLFLKKKLQKLFAVLKIYWVRKKLIAIEFICHGSDIIFSRHKIISSNNIDNVFKYIIITIFYAANLRNLNLSWNITKLIYFVYSYHALMYSSG